MTREKIVPKTEIGSSRPEYGVVFLLFSVTFKSPIVIDITDNVLPENNSPKHLFFPN